MASRTVAQVRLALCQRHVPVPAAASMICPCPASYQKIAFKTRHVAPLSASKAICRASRAAFATQVIPCFGSMPSAEPHHFAPLIC